MDGEVAIKVVREFLNINQWATNLFQSELQRDMQALKEKQNLSEVATSTTLMMAPEGCRKEKISSKVRLRRK